MSGSATKYSITVGLGSIGNLCRSQYGCHICGQFGHKRKECPRRKEVLHESLREAKRSRYCYLYLQPQTSGLGALSLF